MPLKRAESSVRFWKSSKLLLWPVAIALLLTSMCSTALARSSALDARFGREGRALVPVRLQNQAIGYLDSRNWLNTAVATATITGGRVAVAGERTVAVLRSDGKIDRGFGNNGRVSLPLVGEGQTVIKDVAVDSSGNILVLAAARFAKGGGLAIVARLSASGEYDSSFANNGILLTDFGLHAPYAWGPSAPPGAPTDVLPTDLVVDDQGRPVIAGTIVAAFAPCRGAGEQPHHTVYLARLLPNGSLDAGFGSGGVVRDERDPFYAEQHPSMNGLAIHGGAIFYATTNGSECEGFGNGLVVGLNEAGGRNPGFGSVGVLDVTPPTTRALRIAVDRSGRILVMRQATPGETNYLASFEVLSRRNADGTIDAGFGHGGEIALKLPGEEGGLDALAVDARGRPLLAGRVAPPRTTSQVKRHIFAPPRFVLIRLDASGRPDRTFGKRGRVVTGFGRGSRAAATDLAIRGKKAILAGPVLSAHVRGGKGFALARYRLGR
ncbi:MAG TPA: hypothetical protein VFS48_08785 [Solirubrobacterales bacterium]|nr:hypothetical protein [Solirubrobacterales bacterium]